MKKGKERKITTLFTSVSRSQHFCIKMHLSKCRSRHVPLLNLTSFLFFSSPVLSALVPRDFATDTATSSDSGSSSDFGLLSANTGTSFVED